MSVLPTAAQAGAGPKRLADEDRRARIIAAAERAFVRHGFHATTMQHVADEAGMSAGNLYRYFASKEALVEGLCCADQVERSEIFSQMAVGGDIPAAIVATLQEHLLSRPPEKARMIIEIWTEAARNPRIAEITRSLDDDVRSGLERILEAAKAAGAVAATLDSRFAASVIFTLVAGLFKRIALESGFDARAEAAMAVGVLRALFAGAIVPATDLPVREI